MTAAILLAALAASTVLIAGAIELAARIRITRTTATIIPSPTEEDRSLLEELDAR